MRSCIQIKVDELWLRGTCHQPPGVSDDPEAGRTGVLFGNSGWLPRSGRGDLYAHLADSIAREGYWAFRIDMPGLGDSDGDLPPEPLDFLYMQQIGFYGPCFHALAAELKKRYGLTNIILGGHCSAGTSAVFASLFDKEAMVSGLMLLEIGFYTVPRGSLTMPVADEKPSVLRKIFNRARYVARKVVLNAPGHSALRSLYRRVTRVSEGVLGALPLNTNTKLIEAWQGVMNKRVPTLMIKAHHPLIHPGFDFHTYLQMDKQPGITTVIIEGTTHSLLEGNGGEAVQKHCANWLRQHFPARTLAANV